MDRIGDALDGRDVVWSELLDAFAALDENERRRFSWIAPRESDLKWLRQTIVQEKVDRLVGIGCGSGFLERIVADYAGCPVAGVELKDSWWMSKFHPRIFIPTEFTNHPSELANCQSLSGSCRALLFCYFNNGSAFNEYLRALGGEILILIGPMDNVGIHTDPMPLTPQFESDLLSSWTFHDCRYLEDSVNVIAIYKKNANCK